VEVKVGDTTAGTDVDTSKPKIVIPPEERFKRVRLVVTGIPASKIADVNRGILIPISRAVGEFEFAIEVDVSSVEGISRAVLENQIKETIRQIGASLVEETLES